MHVAIDISPLSSGHSLRGIGTYTRLLTETLTRIDPNNTYTLVKDRRRVDADLLHYPYFDFFFLTLPLSRSLPTVVTVHDTIPLIYPDAYPRGLRGAVKFFLQKKALHSTQAIVTDSTQSKADVVKYLGYPEEKVFSIPLAADPEFTPASSADMEAVAQQYGITKPYFLYVGDINYNKNLPALLSAFSQLPDSHQLVLISRALVRSNPAASMLFDLIDTLSLRERMVVVSDADISAMRSLYSGAFWYVQPSLYEGFGLPVLEAMACGASVISTDGGSLPEVAGDAALMCSPTSDSLKEAMEHALSMSDQEREVFVRRGMKRAGDFSFEQTARATIAVYQQVLA